MEEEKDNLQQPQVIQKEKTSSLKSKILMLGLPIFIIQLTAVYFITANILIPEMNSAQTKHLSNESNLNKITTFNDSSDSKSNKKNAGVILPVEDMIINPAQTDGKILLLASIGVSVDDEEAKKALEKKQIIVKDAIISVLSSKNVSQLGDPAYRDSLKIEIQKTLLNELPESKVNNIYFSKFIIQ